MGKEKVLAILHLTISSHMLGVICDVSELNLSAGNGFKKQHQEDSSHEDKEATRFSLINGLVDELPKDRSKTYEPEKQSNDIDNNYAVNGGYIYEKPAIPFEPSRPPLEPESSFEPQKPFTPTYQTEVPLQPEISQKPETPLQPEYPLQPEFPLEPEVPLQPEYPLQPEFSLQPDIPQQPEVPQQSQSPLQPKPEVPSPTEDFGGYQYPRPQNPMTYPPPQPPITTEPTFPEASARSISVEK